MSAAIGKPQTLGLEAHRILCCYSQKCFFGDSYNGNRRQKGKGKQWLFVELCSLWDVLAVVSTMTKLVDTTVLFPLISSPLIRSFRVSSRLRHYNSFSEC